MRLQKAAPCAVLAVFVGLSVASAQKAAPVEGGTPAPQLVAPKAKPRPVVITAELSRTHAAPGDLIRLTEFVPVARGIQVGGQWHSVYAIGTYDFSSESLVNRKPESPLHSSGAAVFDGPDLSARRVTLCAKSPLAFDVTNPRQEGMEFEFKARQVGIYMIKAEWRLLGSDEVVESNPVVLTISPPLDNSGRPVIKEEWVDPIIWKHRPK